MNGIVEYRNFVDIVISWVYKDYPRRCVHASGKQTNLPHTSTLLETQEHIFENISLTSCL